MPLAPLEDRKDDCNEYTPCEECHGELKYWKMRLKIFLPSISNGFINIHHFTFLAYPKLQQQGHAVTTTNAKRDYSASNVKGMSSFLVVRVLESMQEIIAMIH